MHPLPRRWRYRCFLLAAAVFLAASLVPAPIPANSKHRATAPAASSRQTARPLVAIIIDDMGYNLQLDRQFVQMGSRLSLSFLPRAPHARELARQAHAAGHDILVHLPMEPKDKKWRLEPETLLEADDPEQIRKKVREMLAAIPWAAGADNHMGSLFSENARNMRIVIATLKARGIYFVDSVTTPGSQGLAAAQQLRLPSARRHLFLDNDRETDAICRQLHQLAALAQRQGQAIGIGHPNQAMLAALEQCGGKAMQPVELVGVSRLTR